MGVMYIINEEYVQKKEGGNTNGMFISLQAFVSNTNSITNTSDIEIIVSIGRKDNSTGTLGNDANNYVRVWINGDTDNEMNKSLAGIDIAKMAERGRKTFTVKHDAKGELTVSISIDMKMGNGRYLYKADPIPASKTSAFNNSIPKTSRNSIISAAPGTIGETDSFAITFTRYAAENNVEDVITWSAAGYTGTVGSFISSSSSEVKKYTLQINDLLNVLKYYTLVDRFNITFICNTYLYNKESGTLLGTSSSTTSAMFPDYSEQIEIIPQIQEATEKVLNLPGTGLAYFLQNASTLNCQIQAISLYDATITSCTATIEYLPYICNQVGNRWVITTSSPLRNTSDNLTVSIEVIDSRGFSRTINYKTDKAVKTYTPPILERVMTLRCDGSKVEYYKGAYVLLYFNAIIDKLTDSSGSNINEADYDLTWKSTNIEKVIEGHWNMEPDEDLYDRKHGWNATADEDGVFFKLDTNGGEDEDTTEYDITLTVTDKLSVVSYTIHSNTGDRLIHWAADGLHMAFCKMCEEKPLAYVEFGKEASFDKGYLPARVPLKDLNNVFSPGIYSCYDANTDKVVLSNKPFGANARFSLEVRQTDENEYMQTAEWITENGRQAQSRYYRNEVWSDWATSSGSSGGGGGSGGTTDIDDLLPTDVEREKLVSLVMKQLVDAMYPVGSIYIATSSNVNPNNLFVGTKWNKIEGAFLLGSSTSYTLNSKGGAASATVSLNHNHLTGAGIDSDGSIKVVAINKWTEGGSGNLFAGVLHNPADNYGTLNHNINLSYTANTNVSRTVSTMPPYHVVDIWRRDE